MRYLDAAATMPLRPEARAAMTEAFDAQLGNPSSVHSAGYRAREIIDHARGRIAPVFGVRSADVVFTSGGTEADNLGIIGLSLANPRGKHIVTTPIEHPAVLESCRYLQRMHGFELTLVPVDRHGRVDPADVVEALRDDTSLVSVGLANGEIGTVQPVDAIAAVVKAGGALMHTDAVQAAASLPVSLAVGAWPGENVDALAVASHKFGGPAGAGALIVRRNLPLEPLLHGGGQERGARSGTENVAAIAGFAAAVDAVASAIGSRALDLASSRDELTQHVLETVPGARITGHPQERLPGHASFVVEGVSGESLLVALDAAGHAVSSASACAAGKSEPSATLLAIGLPAELATSAIRISLPEPLDKESIERVTELIANHARTVSRRA